MSSTEIIKTIEALPSQEEVAAQLDRLEGAGDTDGLNEVARMAAAYQEYEKRAGAAERAKHFARIKIMAEGRIGNIDLDLHPTGIRLSPLELDGAEVSAKVRGQWRLLGMGLKTGQLDRAMTLAEEKVEPVSTSATVRELHEIGCMYVWAEPLLKRYRELYEQQNLSVRAVSRETGVSWTTLVAFLTRPGVEPRNDKVSRHVALRVGSVLGVEPKDLVSAPRLRRVARQGNLRPSRKLPGGRLDETYSLIRKALKELDAVAGTAGRWGTGEAYDHLYKAEEIIGKALKRAPAVEKPSA